MSYLTSLAILESDLNKDQIPFITLPAFSGMNWIMKEKDNDNILNYSIKGLNQQLRDYLSKEPNGISNLDKIQTAPVDEVLIIGEDEKYSFMKTTPIRGEGYDHLINHLNLNKQP